MSCRIWSTVLWSTPTSVAYSCVVHRRSASNREARSWTVFSAWDRPVRRLSYQERFNPSCHWAIWQRCIATCLTQSQKHSCVLWPRSTSILIQARCSTFVNMVLGRSHYPFESQSSTHCSIHRVLTPLAALTDLTVLVHVHKAGNFRTYDRHATAVLLVLVIQPLYLELKQCSLLYAGCPERHPCLPGTL